MNERALIAGSALLLGGALYLATRRQAAPLRSATPGNALDLEELVVTAARLPAPAGELEEINVTAERITLPGQLEEITVTASRLPETWATKAADAVVEAWNVVKSAVLPRGIRNANPGNLERNGIRWKGMAATQTDPRFVQFTEPKWGVRALGRVLRTYAGRGLVTVRDIIGTWAPKVENQTDAYVAAVARELGVSPDARLDVSARLPQLAAAIIRHENGQQPYNPRDLAEWVNIA